MKTILLLDDEPVVISLLGSVLKQYRVIEATTAEQALRFFIGNGRQVDLLVTDVTLPIASGLQVALLLRSEIPNLPVILISGYSVRNFSERDSSDLERLGANSIMLLQKPFLPQVLRDAVFRLIGVPPTELVTARLI